MGQGKKRSCVGRGGKKRMVQPMMIEEGDHVTLVDVSCLPPAWKLKKGMTGMISHKHKAKGSSTTVWYVVMNDHDVKFKDQPFIPLAESRLSL